MSLKRSLFLHCGKHNGYHVVLPLIVYIPRSKLSEYDKDGKLLLLTTIERFLGELLLQSKMNSTDSMNLFRCNELSFMYQFRVTKPRYTLLSSLPSASPSSSSSSSISSSSTSMLPSAPVGLRSFSVSKNTLFVRLLKE